LLSVQYPYHLLQHPKPFERALHEAFLLPVQNEKSVWHHLPVETVQHFHIPDTFVQLHAVHH
jgi:hypothetical protein